MTLQIGKIYKVKEGHEGNCFYYRAGKGSYIQIIDKNNKDEYFYKILDDNKEFLNVCDSCFTEDDLELEEEVKEICTCSGRIAHTVNGVEICADCNLPTGVINNHNEESKPKSLEDLEVGDEVIGNASGSKYIIKAKGYYLEPIEDKDFEFWETLELMKDYSIPNQIKSISPSEAETLLEERLGIKVKIK